MFIVQFSVRENLLVVTGNPETKELKDMLPDIIKQVGPNQISALKDYLTKMGNIPEGKAGEEDEDDVPELVGNFEDASKKWAATVGMRQAWDIASGLPDSPPPVEDLIGAKEEEVGPTGVRVLQAAPPLSC
jgi:hypothetical protein